MRLGKQHIKSIDAIRTISIFAVVLIHTTTKVLEAVHYDLFTYSFTLLLNQLARFAVPLFFLISGFVLEYSADGELNYFDYLKRRFSKIVIPYIFWSLIYYYFIYNQNRDNIIHVLLTGDASYQLYFIPTLCIFYILFPLLHKIYKFIAHPLVLTVLGAVEFRLLYIDYFLKHGGTDYPTRIAALSFFVFLLGMAAAGNKDKILEFAKRWKYVLLGLSGYMGYYVFNEGKNLYYQIYNIGAIYSQYRPSVLIYTILIALFLLAIFERVDFKKLSGLAYLVFFIHVIVLENTWRFFSGLVNPNSTLDIAFFVAVSGISFLIAFLLHKIPHLAKITG